MKLDGPKADTIRENVREIRRVMWYSVEKGEGRKAPEKIEKLR